MLNPYGNRLGISNFWQGTFNVYFSENLNFKFYELFSIVKFTIDLFILNLFENTKKSKDASFLLLFVSLNLNILKFKNKRLDIFLKVFDYRMFVMFVENNYKTRRYMLLRFLRMFFRLFIFRLKKMKKVKNILDWKLLVFYEHMYKKVITQRFKNSKILKKEYIYINKVAKTKNYFHRILYKLVYFIKLTKTEISNLKSLKQYLRFNQKLNMFFLVIKRKFYKNLINLKKKLLEAKKLKKNKIVFKLYKKYMYFKKFIFLFNNNTKIVTINFLNILQKIKKNNSNRNLVKKNKSYFVFKFYRSNFKILFLKKRPFAFTILQKNIINNSSNLLDDIKNTKNKKIKYSDFESSNISFFSKINYRIFKYSLGNVKKQFLSQINIKKERYFRLDHHNLYNSIIKSIFSNSYFRKVLTLFIKYFKSLEIKNTKDALIFEEKEVKYLNNFFLFVDDNFKKDNFVFLSQKTVTYKQFVSLLLKYKELFKKNIISKEFLLFSKLVIFFYKIQEFFLNLCNNKDFMYSKNVFNMFVSKCYMKTKKQFNILIKPFFFIKKEKKIYTISLTKKNKIEKIKNICIIKPKIFKKLKGLNYGKIKNSKKKKNLYLSLTKYKKNIKLYKPNRKQNMKDVFVNKFDYFFEQAIKKNKKMVIVRMKKCHDNFIVLTLPFLFKIMQMYNFEYLTLKCNFVSSSVSAAMIARYAITRMRQGFSIGQALYGMRFGIKKSKKFAGFKFCAAGRFSRRQIATYRWIKGGSLAINTRIFGFDYAHDNFIGTFGIYGFKVWLLKAKKKINHTYG